MGFYTACFAGCLVVLQATLLLLNRAPSQWSYSLVQRDVVDGDWGGIAATFAGHPLAGDRTAANFTRHVARPYLAAVGEATALGACLRDAWTAGAAGPPDHCRRWGHPPQRVDAVMQAFNPHLILLAVASAHLVVCLTKGLPDSGTYRLHEIVNLPGAVLALAVLTIVVALITSVGYNNPDLLRYPTILVVVLLFLCTGRYAYVCQSRPADTAWSLTFHLQVVGVPLTVVMLTAMGVRFWIDALVHTLLLSAAVNALWLQCIATDRSCRAVIMVARFMAVLLPTFCVCATQQQWGVDSWQHVVAIMAAASLAPLYILTIMQTVLGVDKEREKLDLRIAHLCTSAGLLSAIVNMAMI